MSSIRLFENRLIQEVRGVKKELGCVELEPETGKYVLWLKDEFGVALTAGSRIRADEYLSLEAAKSEVLMSWSVFIWHLIWMRNVLKDEIEKELRQNWDDYSADGIGSSIQVIMDRFRAYIDRLPIDIVKKTLKTIDNAAGIVQMIKELIEKFQNGE